MRPIIYVSHPFGGDAANVTRARETCKAFAKQLPEALFVPALSVTCRPTTRVTTSATYSCS